MSDKDFEEAIDFAEEGVATSNETLLIRISWAVGWGFYNSIQVEGRETAIIKNLMAAKQVGVCKNVIGAFSRFSKERRKTAIAMLLSIEYCDIKNLQTRFFSKLGSMYRLM